MRRKTAKKVLVSFPIANIAGANTFMGVLRYLQSIASWRAQIYMLPMKLTPAIIERAKEDGIDGILLNYPISEDLIDPLLRSNIPLVTTGNTHDRLFKRRKSVAFLAIDNRRIGQEGANHFLSHGRYRTFGFLPDIPENRWTRLRLRGFASVLRKHGHTASVFTTCAAPNDIQYRTDLSAWLKAMRHPAAVMLAGDYLATFAIEACKASGLTIPSDIALLGVDNDPTFCTTISPSLSSIEPQFEQEGYEAAQTLDKLMRSRKAFERPLIIRVPPKRIVERDSTGYVSTGANLTDRAMDFIRKNSHLRISARDVASQLNVSPTLLALRFRQYEHTTVREAIIQQRLRRAAGLIRRSNTRITKIAQQCGFASANRFSHLFQERYGLYPTDFRKQSRNRGLSPKS